MKIRRYALVVLLALAVPVAAVAGPLHAVQFDSGPDDGDGHFNSAGTSGYDGLEAPDGVFVDGVSTYLEMCINCGTLALNLRWSVGPLVAFDPSVDPTALPGMGTYLYGPGTLWLDGYWSDGVVEPEILMVSITSLVIELNRDSTFGLGGTTRAELGRGFLHESLARLLGTSQYILDGSYGIDTDGAFFFGSDGYGLGDNYGPGLSVTVPEPASIAITALGLMAVATRRRQVVRRSPRTN